RSPEASHFPYTTLFRSWNGQQVFEEKELAGQIRQALQNIVDVLAEAGGKPEHIVRLTWYITDKKDYLANLKGIGEAYRTVMGKRSEEHTSELQSRENLV